MKVSDQNQNVLYNKKRSCFCCGNNKKQNINDIENIYSSISTDALEMTDSLFIIPPPPYSKMDIHLNKDDNLNFHREKQSRR